MTADKSPAKNIASARRSGSGSMGRRATGPGAKVSLPEFHAGEDQDRQRTDCLRNPQIVAGDSAVLALLSREHPLAQLRWQFDYFGIDFKVSQALRTPA